MSKNKARPKLIIPVVSATKSEEKGKKVVDSRIQKLNTILGPRGIRADELLRKFDGLTLDYEPGTPIPVYLDVMVDGKGKSIEYSMTLGLIPTSHIVRKKLNKEKLSQKPDIKNPIFTANKEFVDDIIKEKTKFSQTKFDYNAMFKSLIGTLSSYGIAYSD